MQRRGDKARVGRQPVATAPRRRNWSRSALAWLAFLAVGLVAVYTIDRASAPRSVGAPAFAALTGGDPPTRGAETAKVHIVEFLDPACETCAQFSPLVERILAQNAGKVRLSIRHLALHDGSEYAIRVLEASRNQDKYWDMLEALLSTQRYWAPDHRPNPERIRRVASMLDLNQESLMQDLDSSAVNARIDSDRDVARVLKIASTPRFFVNGRMPARTGEAQLLALIAQELREGY
jgi:protein-disulfide isomerase